MKRSVMIALTMCYLALVACGSDGGSSTSTKNFYSIWERTDGQVTLDFTDVVFDTSFDINLWLGSGEVCKCSTLFTGAETSGSITVSNCTYTGGGGGDPGCVALWENAGAAYTYTKSSLTLSLCNTPNSCGTYR